MNSDTKIIAGVISFAVIIIVIASVLVPVINESQTSVSHIERNTGYNYTMRELQPGETWTYTNVDGTTATVNGEPVDLSGFTSNDQAFYVISDQFVFRVIATSVGGWFMPINGTGEGGVVKGQSLSIADGSATVTTSKGTYSYNLAWCLVYAGDDGDLAYYNYPNSAQSRYVDKNSEIYIIAPEASIDSTRMLRAVAVKTPLGAADYNAYLRTATTSESGGTVNTWTDAAGKVSVVTNASDFDGVSYKVTQAELTYDGASAQRVVTWMIMPVEYHRADASDTAVHSIMSVIPIMCIIAVVVGAVQLIRTRE